MTDIKVFVLGQETSKGFLYFNGKTHPINPDAWTKSQANLKLHLILNIKRHLKRPTNVISESRKHLKK